MPLTIDQVPKLVFGVGAISSVSEYLQALGIERPFIVSAPSSRDHAERLRLNACIDDSTSSEPTLAHFNRLIESARSFRPDAVIGIGGGSVLDAAKLIAALCNSSQPIAEAFGIGNLGARNLPLICIPTTAGTGSEVSPNSILLDEDSQSKKAVISPQLVPDAAFIDPALTVTVPAHVTATTGLDALTHCIEAFANNFSHPLVDTWALDGIRHIAAHLATAVREPANIEARTHLALGSLYGGLCLGPVNTAAVHALSYPLGSRYHIPHGHANAIFLPHVIRFNLSDAPERYAAIALALGAQQQPTLESTALAGIDMLWQLIANTGLEMRLAAFRIPESEIPSLAADGLAVTRLMKNNLRVITQQDAESIYRYAYLGQREA
ncbi:MAG: iron-containing alcohol dehydrogenase [Terracidiphilus sp.]|jgi:alcohol dehydrogenase class IV